MVDIARDLSGLPVEGLFHHRLCRIHQPRQRLRRRRGQCAVRHERRPRSGLPLGGLQRLFGADALGFSSVRHIAGGDIHSLVPPRVVMLAALNAFVSARHHGTTRLVQITLARTWTDLGPGEVLTLAAGAFEVGPATVDNIVLPGGPAIVTGGAAVVLLDESSHRGDFRGYCRWGDRRVTVTRCLLGIVAGCRLPVFPLLFRLDRAICSTRWSWHGNKSGSESSRMSHRSTRSDRSGEVSTAPDLLRRLVRNLVEAEDDGQADVQHRAAYQAIQRISRDRVAHPTRRAERHRVVATAEMYWANLGAPANRRPVCILTCDPAAGLGRIVADAESRALFEERGRRWWLAPSGLPAASVVNCDNIVTVANHQLDPNPIGRLGADEAARTQQCLRYAPRDPRGETLSPKEQDAPLAGRLAAGAWSLEPGASFVSFFGSSAIARRSPAHYTSRHQSAICHLPSATPSAICHLPSAICHLPSAICHLPSAIRHPPSAIRHPSSAICHLPSTLAARHQEPWNPPTRALVQAPLFLFLSRRKCPAARSRPLVPPRPPPSVVPDGSETDTPHQAGVVDRGKPGRLFGWCSLRPNGRKVAGAAASAAAASAATFASVRARNQVPTAARPTARTGATAITRAMPPRRCLV